MKSEAPKIKLVKLSKIVTDAGTQIRAKLDEFTVDDYALAMMDSANKFPPVVVFHDGDRFILADGFHRKEAASRNGFLDIEAEIHKGTQRDAFTYALGANVNHGLRRTNADKRNAVTLALDAWPDISDNQVAKLCGVSHPFVGIVRAQLVTVTSCDPSAKRLGADNKYRKPPVKPDPEPTPEPSDPEPEPTPKTPAERNDETLKAAFGGTVPTIPNREQELAKHLDSYRATLLALRKDVPRDQDFNSISTLLQQESAFWHNRDRDARNGKAYTK